MTDAPSKAALAKANELAVAESALGVSSRAFTAFARYIDAHPEPQEGWRGIGSAPKDGTVVLLYKQNERMVGEYTLAGYWGEWAGLCDGWIACAGKPLGYYSNCAESSQGYPTHWQPLPAPPTDATPETPPEPHEALEPCPFCGGKATIYAWANQHEVSCGTCYCRTDKYGPTDAAKNTAITAWNTRPPNPLQAENDALRARVAVLESEVEKWEQKAEMDWADQYRD